MINIPILFQDRHFVVLNKPAGLPVHPGPSGGPSVEDIFPTLSRRPDGPWLAHRLDADTAGCLVVALRHQPLLAAQAEFAAGRAKKTYWAIVQGTPTANSGTINAPLLKRSLPTGWHMEANPAGQTATTEWQVLGRGPNITWLELHPHTGRTHQIRVHCATLGHPIQGDPIYSTTPGTLHLLSHSIHLNLTPPLTAQAPPPAHMHPALRACGWK